jgi:hypothetical protein
MGHFVIPLDGKSFADVRFGTVTKKQFLGFRNLFSRKWWRREKWKGYIVTTDQREKYMLLKTLRGEWINETTNEQYSYWQTKIDKFEKTNHRNR